MKYEHFLFIDLKTSGQNHLVIDTFEPLSLISLHTQLMTTQLKDGVCVCAETQTKPPHLCLNVGCAQDWQQHSCRISVM